MMPPCRGSNRNCASSIFVGTCPSHPPQECPTNNTGYMVLPLLVFPAKMGGAVWPHLGLRSVLGGVAKGNIGTGRKTGDRKTGWFGKCTPAPLPTAKRGESDSSPSAMPAARLVADGKRRGNPPCASILADHSDSPSSRGGFANRRHASERFSGSLARPGLSRRSLSRTARTSALSGSARILRR